MRKGRSILAAIALMLAVVPAANLFGKEEALRVAVETSPDGIDVRIDGELFATYHHAGEGHVPYFYPVYGPGQVPMTRNWPMSEGAHEETDHQHHRSLWFAHGNVNGHDFWTGQDGSRIEHLSVLERASGETGRLVTTNRWIDPDGAVIALESRTMAFQSGHVSSSGGAPVRWRAVDFDVTLRPVGDKLRFGDTKEGTMAVRVAAPLRHKGEVANGHIRNSAGQADADCWGKRARWVDFYGSINAQPVGIAMFDHPRNHSHPTWWHARTYGLFAANPFGVHDFENKPPGTGTLELGSDESLRLRYRLLFYTGELEPNELERLFVGFAASE